MPMQPKPDDRRNNVERLQQSLSNTVENMRETEDYLEAHEVGPEQSHDLARQQEQRADAIEGYRTEIEDEAEDPSR